LPVSELHDQLADALVDVLKGSGIKVAYKWGPRNIKPPCAVVQLPTFRRVDPDQSEDHIGGRDWRLEFNVLFCVELTEKPRENQAFIAKRVEQFIDAIDDLKPGPSGLILNELCTDAKVTESVPFVEPRDQKRDLIGYVTHVSILTFK
jgi:hypothetical protein